jgi:hypothetical protein
MRQGDTLSSSSHISGRLAAPPEAYEHFDARDAGWTKVVLKTSSVKMHHVRQGKGKPLLLVHG